MSSHSQRRVSRGVPDGGQFAEQARGEPESADLGGFEAADELTPERPPQPVTTMDQARDVIASAIGQKLESGALPRGPRYETRLVPSSSGFRVDIAISGVNDDEAFAPCAIRSLGRPYRPHVQATAAELDNIADQSCLLPSGASAHGNPRCLTDTSRTTLADVLEANRKR